MYLCKKCEEPLDMSEYYEDKDGYIYHPDCRPNHEITALKNFIIEFNPLFNEETLRDVPYDELVSIAKEVAKGL